MFKKKRGFVKMSAVMSEVGIQFKRCAPAITGIWGREGEAYPN